MGKEQRQESIKYLPTNNGKDAVAIFSAFKEVFHAVLSVVLPSVEYLKIFVGRIEERKELRDFIHSDTSSFCVIKGEPGVGKTFLTLKIIDEILEKEEACGVFCLARDILKTKQKYLKSPEVIEHLVSHIAHKNHLSTVCWNTQNEVLDPDVPIVLVIDGLNESSPFDKLTVYLNSFAKGIEKLRLKRKIKLIITCRSNEWDYALRKMVRYTRAPITRISLKGLKTKQRELLTRKYQRHIGLKVLMLFKGEDLSPNPLDIVLEVKLKISGRKYERNNHYSLLNAYCEWMFEDIQKVKHKEDI